MYESKTNKPRFTVAKACAVMLALLILAITPCLAFANEGSGSLVSAQEKTKGANVTGKANKHLIFDTEDDVFPVNCTWFDITGDGYADKVRFDISHKDPGVPILNIYINGKLSRKCQCGYWYTGQIVTLRNGTPFLYISGGNEPYSSESHFYQYVSPGKMKEVCKSSALLKKKQGEAQRVYDNFKLSGNTITIPHRLVTFAAGRINVTFKYKFKNGTLVRESNTTASVRYADPTGEEFGKLKVKSSKSFMTYKSTTLKKKAFKIKAGQSLVITACNTHGGELYMKVYNGKKSGWFKAFTGTKKTNAIGEWAGKPVIRGCFVAYND